MKKYARRSLSLLLAAAMLLTGFAGLLANAVTAEEMYPSIVLPGLFQGNATLYDENGNIAVNSDGEELKAPFFIDSTMDIVDMALKEAGIPLLSTLAFQRDFDDKFANALGHTLGEVLLGKVASDSNGNFIKDVRPTIYPTSVANLSQAEKDYVYRTIPLTAYKNIAGEEKLYFFSFFSFENMDKVVERLYELIQTVKEETGFDKVNLVPISQGGTLCNALLETYRDDDAAHDIFDDLNRIIYIIPALNGSATIGDIYYYGLLDDDDALYSYMFPLLLEKDQEWLGYLINTLIKIFPKQVLNDVLDIAVDILIEEYLEYCTLMWGLMPQAYYPELRERYLSDPEDAVIREQTDRYYRAQVNSLDNIMAAYEHGIDIFDIVNYNDALYPICDSWNKCQADGIIQLESTSMGAYGIAVDTQLPEGYVQQNTNTTCSDPANHIHIDPHNLIDASTGLLPDQTFYFYNGDHERTGDNDVVMRLVTRLLTDQTFKNVYSDPENYPQFNTARKGKNLQNDVDALRPYLTDESLSEETRARLQALIDEMDALIADTAVSVEDWERLEAAKAEMNKVRNLIYYGKEDTATVQDKIKASLINLLTKLLKVFHRLQYAIEGGRGFTDLPDFNRD